MGRIRPFASINQVRRLVGRTHSELRAVRGLLPKDGVGMEIGVGSGRFAAPLGIRYGVDPSVKMRTLAQARGIEAVEGVAEKLPYRLGPATSNPFGTRP